MNWTSPPVSRNGNCCGTSNPDRCLEFVITLHPSAIAINFQITGGAVPPGALFYQIDCGPVTPVGSPICLDGPGPHTLTFCKPGNNNNEFTITSYSEPIIGPDISLNAACQGFIYGNYYNEASINWTSVGPGAPGTYDNLLSCTAGCDTTFVTAPGSGAPAFVDYEVCGMDVGGCNPNPICDTIRVTFIPPVEVTISSAGPFCAGSTTTLTANVSGGSGPYNILWSTAETTSSITAGAGAYSVQVTDTSGCLIATDNINLVALPLPNVDAGADQMVCDGDQVTLSGSGASTYAWDNGITDGVAFTPAVGTITYTVTGTDANGCVNTDQVDITVNPLPIVDAGADQTVCDGDQVTLSGSGAATYAWDNGVTDGVAFTPAVGTITYTVTGTDANGCVNTDQVDVTVNPLPIVDAGADQTVCDGDQVTLNGSGAATYAWDNGITDGVVFTPAVGTTTYTVTGTDANGCVNTDQVDVIVNPLPIVDAGADQTVCEGTQVTLSGSGASTYTWDNGVTDGVAFTPAVGTTTYTVTGTDANGCVNTDQVDVTVNPLPIVDAGADQTVCEGTQVTLSGSGASTYAWDNGVTDGVAFTPGVGTTTYTVTGTDANGCVNTDQVDVTVSPLPIVDAGADQTVCEGTQVTLSGSGAATYAWDNGITDGVAFTPAVGTTTYTVTGTDANGCVNTDQVDVTVNPLPNVDAGADQTVCDGDQVTLSGSGAATYTWDNGITNGVAFTPAVGTTTYTVTGTDANGCVNTDQVDVTVNPLPIVDAGADQTVCDGDQVTLSGSGAATYAWDNGITDGVAFTPAVGTTTYTVTGTDANGCVNTDQVDVTVNPLPNVDAGADQTVCDGDQVTLSGSGAATYAWDNGVTDGVAFTPAVGTTTYTVTGTDANGCVNTDQVDVTVNPLPIVDAGPDQTVCEGDQVTLSGSGASTYAWDNGITDGVAFTPAVGTTTYTVTGTDANGCVNTDQVDVTVNPLPIVDAGVDQTVCEGTQVTLSGSGAATYTWDNGITDGVAFTPAVGTTTYTVTGTDANGCVNTDQVDVTVNPLPIVDAGPDQTVCEGTQVTLSGSGASTYAWDNGITDGVAFTPALGTTTYTVNGTDANGCVNTDQVDVTVNPLPIVSAGEDFAVCEGLEVTLTAVGSPNLVWGGNVVNGVAFVPNGTQEYVVYDTLSTGCSASDTIEVVVNDNPIVSAPDAEICPGEGVTLNGAGAVTYSWNNGVIDGETFYPTQSGEYIVTGTDANGCEARDTSFVRVLEAPIVAFKILDLSLTTIDPTTGFQNQTTGATSYEWNFGDGSGINTEFEPTHTFPDDEPGEYEIILTAYSNEGCPAQAVKYVHVFSDYTIYVPNAFTPDGSGVNEIFKPVMDGFDPNDYELIIFNRWGDIIFESHNMEVGWDGTYAGQDFQTQDGVYTWKITAGIENTNDTKIFVGHVSLLK
ncbi:MAG: hypothetical protein Crog3KO_25860 [Crocinitomicaceae bacterium]